jgi:phosphoglycolate phosphatase-like HAD superfamily hydrolase
VAVLYLFDIDGTLLRADGAGTRAFDAALAACFGLADASRGVRFGGKTDHAILDEILVLRRGRPAADDERVRFLAAYLPALERELDASPGFRVLPGAIAALDYLAGRGDVVIGIATGNIADGARAKLRRAGLADRFAVGGYGCDSASRPALVACGIERGRAAGAEREVVVVGDTIHDIAAARACGAIAVAVATGSDPKHALGDADVVWDALDELPAWHAARFS